MRLRVKLDKEPKVVAHQGYISKQGDALNNKIERRLVHITTSYFKWYHNEKEVAD